MQNQEFSANEIPSLEGDTEESGTNVSVDLHNQGLIEIDSNDLEPTRIDNSAENQPHVTRDTEESSFANTRDDESSSEDDQIVVITGNEAGRGDEYEELVQNENTGGPTPRRFDHLQFKARLKIFAERQPLKLVQKLSVNKTL